jgi:hypothetical protein
MDDKQRMEEAPVYPKAVYLETLFLWMGGNFIYHQRVFRQNQMRVGFTLFMLVNLWTSQQVAEAFNPYVHQHIAAALNNLDETEHRKKMTETYRRSVLTPRI